MEEEKDQYKLSLQDMVERARIQADPRYFVSGLFYAKNVPVLKQYEDIETGKWIQLPLVGSFSHYAGDFIDMHGKWCLAVCTGYRFLFFPIIEMFHIPEILVHTQRNCILINAVSVDRMNPSLPYFPTIRTKQGKILRWGYTLMDEFYFEKVASGVIKDQGNLFKQSVDQTAQLNPHVKFSQKARRTDTGG